MKGLFLSLKLTNQSGIEGVIFLVEIDKAFTHCIEGMISVDKLTK